MAAAMSSLRWLTGSSAGYVIGGMAARRAALAAARSACDLDRPGRPDRSRADPAGEDVTALDSIPAGRIDQEDPCRITVFRAAAFRQPPPILSHRLSLGYLLARPHGPLELPASASRLRQGCDRDPNCVICFFNHSNSITSLVNLGLAWLIRASWLIWGSIVHRINHVAPINHDLSGEGVPVML